MHAFKRLLKTDLRNRRNTIFINLGVILISNIILALLPFQLNIPQTGYNFVMTLNIIVFFAVLYIPLLNCFSTWREEWKQHAIFQLLSLPVPRTYLLISKYISILIEFLLISVVMLTGLSVQNWLQKGLLFRVEPLITLNWSKGLFITEIMFSVTCLIFLCFFSTLLGKCFRRFSQFITFITFFVGCVISIIVLFTMQPLFVSILLSLIYFFGSLYLLEKKVGIE